MLVLGFPFAMCATPLCVALNCLELEVICVATSRDYELHAAFSPLITKNLAFTAFNRRCVGETMGIVVVVGSMLTNSFMPDVIYHVVMLSCCDHSSPEV